jgi:polysaccharide export outer membrane protein
MTSEAARDAIQTQIETVLPSAQVQLSLAAAGRGNSVDLVGGVARPGIVPLPDRDFSVLGLIGLGGGVSERLRNPQVRLVREGRDYAVSLARLYAEPGLDTTLRGGDKVIVIEDDRYFLALGASGREQVVPFDRDTISALDAMSMMGGVDDRRGNPQGILILREYPAGAVREGPEGPDHQRVVFTLDLTRADGLFSARNFLIRPGDLVLATESPVTSAETVLGIFGRGVGIVRQANAIN